MSKILLIHGYGIGIKYSIFKDVESEDAGFLAFKDLVEKHEAAVFRWDIPDDFDIKKILDVKNHLKHYDLEKERAASEDVHTRLHATLEIEKPSIVICHSMGAFLLLSYLESYSIPDYIKTVIFVQADVPDNVKINDKRTLERLMDKSLVLINYYCPWDPALAVATIYNKYRPAGIFKIKSSYVTNKLFPLYNKLNLHRSSIENKKWLEEIEMLFEKG